MDFTHVITLIATLHDLVQIYRKRFEARSQIRYEEYQDHGLSPS